jgi:hypothetical protein
MPHKMVKPKGAKVIVKKVNLTENRARCSIHEPSRKTSLDNITEEKGN